MLWLRPRSKSCPVVCTDNNDNNNLITGRPRGLPSLLSSVVSLLLILEPGAYKQCMRYLSSLVFFAVTLAGFFAPSARAFDGEVLLAPPPPNWTSSIHQSDNFGQVRVWRPPLQGVDLPAEKIMIVKVRENGPKTVRGLLQFYAQDLYTDCQAPEFSSIQPMEAAIGIAAQMTVDCAMDQGLMPQTVRHTRIAGFIGEFASYAVARTWTGHINDPTSPLQSETTSTIWTSYFEQLSVCNTLSDACDRSTTVRIHADPKFTTLRDAPVTSRPTLPLDDVMTAAINMGDITAKATACGEDTSLFLRRLPKMFEYVLGSEIEARAAMAAFDTIRTQRLGSSDASNAANCDDIRQAFRAHPSRAQSFAPYIQSLLADAS
jgi:hypothetical protein